MRPLLKKQHLTLAILLLVTTTGYAQKEFFRSQQVFTKEQMSTFISSVTIHNNVVLFSANDYQLYAYNKNNGALKWSYEASYKSSTPPFVQDSIVYTGIYTNKEKQAVQLDLSTGKLIKVLPFGPLATQPFIKNGMLYGTAIYNFGCMLAYDMKKDTVTWSRFIAHGYERQPYFQEKKIMANTEGDNWVALGYDGVLLDTTCAKKASMYVEDIPCVKIFTALTHDGREIKGKLTTDIMGGDLFAHPELLTTAKFTFVLYDDKLTILSGKMKIKQQVEVTSLVEDLVGNVSPTLLKADNENVWLLYNDHLLQYDHKTKKMVQVTDLTVWQPNSVLLDEGNIWLVSGKDGLLYGLSL